VKKIIIIWMFLVIFAVSLTFEEAVLAQAEEFNWRKHEGEKINIVMARIPFTDMIGERINEFEELTGISVTFSTMTEDQSRIKTSISLSSNSSDIDVFSSMTIQEGLKFHNAGWYEPLKNYIENKELTNPNFDFGDYGPATIDIASVEGELVGIPVSIEGEILFYRKDLLAEAGLEVPKTFEELEAACAKLDNPDAGIYGIVGRGQGANATSAFSGYLYGFGGRWLDENGEPAIAEPEAIEAFKYYGRLLREYGQPGAQGDTWTQCLPIFTSGKAAFWTDSGDDAPVCLDPEQSQISDKVGFAVLPGGKAGSVPYVYGWIFSISPYSDNKEAAWYFVQWATSKEIAFENAAKGIRSARLSASESDEFKKVDKSPELTQTMIDTLEVGRDIMNPHILNVQEFRDIAGTVIITAIEGGNVEEAANNAVKNIKKMLLNE